MHFANKTVKLSSDTLTISTRNNLFVCTCVKSEPSHFGKLNVGEGLPIVHQSNIDKY